MIQPIQKFALRIWGDYACFTRPEMKVERVSYDVLTPSAARGIFEAVYWKPEITWVVDAIHVYKPIRFTNLRRNEIRQKVSASSAKTAMKAGRGKLGFYADEGDNRQQRAATILRDVEYIVEAHFVVRNGDDKPQKHSEMFRRRASKGQYFHHPYLGNREFPANFELFEGDLPPSDVGTKDLGFMLHDIDFDDNMAPRFFRADMQDGVIQIPPFNSKEVVA
ncbi:MAG: type I-C CRISPR-associated protein Cas5c [Rubripirellula sp.]